MASQITSKSNVCSTAYLGSQQRKRKKVHITVPLWGQSTGDQWIPLMKGQEYVKHFHGMISSCVEWNFRKKNHFD